MTKYGNQFVDEKYSSAIEPNLYADTILVPGMTYTNKYEEGPAGGIFVHKLDKGTAVTVKAPGQDFTDEAAEDALIPIIMNNNYQKSRKIYGVQAAAVAFAAGEEYLADSLAQVREAREDSALACMVQEGTKDSDTTAIATSDAAVAKLLELRKMVRAGKGRANFALVNTTIYTLLLGKLGLASSADPSIISGELMKRFGLNIIEFNNDSATAKYFDNGGTARTVDLTKVEMIVGNNEAFSVIDNFSSYRIVDSENFSGSKAQVEINSGMTVNSPAQIAVKKHV